MDILKISNLSKSFADNKVIDNLSLTVKQNTIYGFLGQNGAGKTTVMKMILGLHTIDQGQIEVNNQQVTFGQTTTNQYIGYLADVPAFYDFMTGQEYLKLCANISNISNQQQRIDEMLDLVGLTANNNKIGGYSRGMRQRLGIAQALLAKPLLLICDEPTSALDPLGRVQILDILKQASSQTTVIFSTHILTDVERICDHVGILHHGQLVIDTDIKTLTSQYANPQLQITFNTQQEQQLFIDEYGQDLAVEDLQVTIANYKLEHIYLLLNLLSIYPPKIEVIKPSLESVFMEVTNV